MPGVVEIVTSGERVNSPYPSRRKFYVKVKGSIKLLERIAEVLEYALPSVLPPFREYVYSFCKYCDWERDELCPRHRVIIELPIGNISNWEYTYRFELYSYRYFDIVKMHLEVGASGWVVDGAIVYYYDDRKPHGAIRVIRPSGKAFTYKLRPGQPSSAAYIISDVIDFLHFIVDASYTRVEVVE